MNLVGFLFPPTAATKYVVGEFKNIELDAILEETHEWKVEATSNPVEEGSPVSDHIILHPDRLRVRGWVSDQSITLSSNIFDAKKYGTQKKTEYAFETFREIMKAKGVLTVYTKNRTYTNMVLTDLNIPRSAGNGESLEFVMDFLEIRKVETRIVDIPDGIGNKKAGKSNTRKASASEDKGSKSAEKVTPKPSSLLSRVFN
jgi:hypothetical protein